MIDVRVFVLDRGAWFALEAHQREYGCAWLCYCRRSIVARQFTLSRTRIRWRCRRCRREVRVQLLPHGPRFLPAAFSLRWREL